MLCSQMTPYLFAPTTIFRPTPSLFASTTLPIADETVWVRVDIEGKVYLSEVERGRNVALLRSNILTKFSPRLNNFAAADLTVSAAVYPAGHMKDGKDVGGQPIADDDDIDLAVASPLPLRPTTKAARIPPHVFVGVPAATASPADATGP